MSGVSDTHFGCAGQVQGVEETPMPGDRPQDVPFPPVSATYTDDNEEMIITSIRATDVALGLRRLPAGFYVVVQHGGFEWRTENERLSVNDDVVEWNGPIPIPSTLSAAVCLKVYASFEFQPMLGDGEQLRKLTMSVEQLLDKSTKHVPFTLFPKDGDIVSPCTSVLVTVKQRKRHADLPASKVLIPNSSTESRGELEDRTNQGHAALSRYRKQGIKRDLKRSVKEFEKALNICPLDPLRHAAAQANLAMVKFILSQVEDKYVSLGVPLSLYRAALASRPAGHLDRPSTLIQLAAVHLARFKKGRDKIEWERAETLLHEATELSPVGSHENRAATFMLQFNARREVGPVQELGQSPVKHASTSRYTEDAWDLSVELLDRFGQFEDLVDLEQAIAILEELVRNTSVWDDEHCAGLVNLGVALRYRFDHLEELSDLEDAISKHRDAVQFTPHGHPDRPSRLYNLGDSFRTRFEHLGELSDIEDAISSYREAVALTPNGHPNKPGRLTNLGISLKARFEHLGELSDLEEAISVLRDAIELTPDGHPDKPGYLNNLGVSFKARFQCVEELRDIEDAIPMLRDAVVLTSRDDPDKPDYLCNLGNAFVTRFEHLGMLRDLEDAITMYKDAVDLTPYGHPDKPDSLNYLGTSLFTRFERVGELTDLEGSIAALREAVDLTPHGHPDKPRYINNLGTSIVTRFERLRGLSDLEDAISMLKDAVHLTPHESSDRSGYLDNLGTSFFTRFEHLGETSDLEEAISMLREAVDLIPDGHPDKPARLSNLGITFRARFEYLEELSDLEDAISMLRDAIDHTPHGHPHKAGHLNNLGTFLLTRFKHLRELSDLEAAISMLRDAVNLNAPEHPDKPICLNSLGNALFSRFEHLAEMSDLEGAISRYMDAANLTPHGHPNKLGYLNNLGRSFVTRFEHLGVPSDLQDAISFYSHAATTPIGPIRLRFRASQEWISCVRRIQHHSLLHAYSVAITLLPQLAWIGLSLTHRYSELVHGAEVVREAAAAALDAGHPETAVEWLEQGRSIVWGELLHLRGSYEELSSAHPDRARRLRELSAALENASATHEKSLSALSERTQSTAHRAKESLQDEADRHRALAIERDKLLHEIRRLPGFEQFLLHKEFSRLRASANSGPVVILNAAETRCDAFIVLANVDHVIHAPLSKFTFQRSLGIQNMMKSLLSHARVVHPEDRKGDPATRGSISWQSLLSVLWNGVVKPILDALAFSIPGDLSRIFWCPTGPFVFLPVHAAGVYDNQHSQPGHKVSDFVVSSYIPTLGILVLSPNLSREPSDDLRLLTVRQPSSDGLPPLPGVDVELEHIKAIIRNSPSARTTLLESSVGTVEEVLELMKVADWVHFACHGIQDAADSGLCLADGRRLKLSDIIALSRPRGGLAFLSACQTAMGDEDLSDEAIHIAAGMLFAGYGAVVGTMWSISDKLAPYVARDVYEQLFQNGTRPDYRGAARALHDAVGRLRESGKVSFTTWLPFIHVGL